MSQPSKKTVGTRAAVVAKSEAPATGQPTPRQRMLRATAALLAERGLSGTSFSDIIERSGAPRGSIYHHFPDGKDGLTAEVIAIVGERVLSLVRPFDGATSTLVVRRFVEGWRVLLMTSGFKAGCALAAVANERIQHPALGAQAAAVFIACERQLAETLVTTGLSLERAGRASSLIIASLEGALILCRARGGIEPLDAVEEALVSYVGQ